MAAAMLASAVATMIAKRIVDRYSVIVLRRYSKVIVKYWWLDDRNRRRSTRIIYSNSEHGDV